MHGKFPAAQWVEHCTAFAVRVRIEILYRGTCRFVLSFFFFFMISFLIIFRSFVAIPNLYQSNMLAGVSVGFPPLLSKFTLSKCTLKLRKCIGTLLNFFFSFFFVVSFWVFYGNPLPGGLTFCFSVWFLFNFFFFRSPVAITILYQPKSSLEYLCILLFSLYYISQGFLPLIVRQNNSVVVAQERTASFLQSVFSNCTMYGSVNIILNNQNLW